jgi:hypothetical protein
MLRGLAGGAVRAGSGAVSGAALPDAGAFFFVDAMSVATSVGVFRIPAAMGSAAS